jgi:zinc/manganese transport system substrate-binding protein
MESTMSFVRCFLIASIFAAPGQAYAKLSVVTSTMDLASIASAVGGEHAQVESICAAGQDPHYIQARPSFMRSMADADLFIRIGLELEKAWETPLLRGSRNAKIQLGEVGHLDVSERIAKLGLPTQTVDRSMGDIHGQGNPHYWLDPYNGRIIAQTIADRLVKLDPDHAADYEKNLASFMRRLDEQMFGPKLVARFGGETLWREDNAKALQPFLSQKGATVELGGWRARAARVTDMPIVTFHASWVYLTKRFDVPVAETLEPKPGIPPSPGHLVNVIRTIQERKVGLILIEPFYDRKVGDFVGAKTGVPVALVPNDAESENPNAYLEMLDHVIAVLSNAASQRS